MSEGQHEEKTVTETTETVEKPVLESPKEAHRVELNESEKTVTETTHTEYGN
jgi:hypothetical protein